MVSELGLPQHGLCVPQLILKLSYKLAPDQVVEQCDVEYVDYENGSVLYELCIEAVDVL